MNSGTRATIYQDTDSDLTVLADKVVSVIGYGNQGAAQAQNLRDSGISVVVGNRDDQYRDQARADDFHPISIADAATRGDVVLLLVPDEVQPQVVADDVAPHLKRGDTVVLASGYNWTFDLLEIPAGVDVVMVAPRMIGAAVRDRFLAQEGYPCFVSVERDDSGNGWQTGLAIADGIGGTRQGAIASTAQEETALDLFAEQALWPAIVDLLATAYTVQRDAGFSDDAILNEMYLSAEPAEVFARAAEQGLLNQLRLHSQTSQYGQLRALRYLAERQNPMREYFQRVLHRDIIGGAFATEWSRPEAEDRLEALRAEACKQPLPVAEHAVRTRRPTR